MSAMPVLGAGISATYSRARAECPADHLNPVLLLAAMSYCEARATAASTSRHRSGTTQPRKRSAVVVRSVDMAINGDKHGEIGLTNTRCVQSAAGKDALLRQQMLTTSSPTGATRSCSGGARTGSHSAGRVIHEKLRERTVGSVTPAIDGRGAGQIPTRSRGSTACPNQIFMREK